MKIIWVLITASLGFLLIPGCGGKSPAKKDATGLADTLQVPDTGYTGIKKYYSGNLLIKEITFKNGVRHGEMKSYYQGGQLYQTFWYENGLREDSARWYYTEGQVFRSTPFRNDTIDGIQQQYYRNGRIKARLGFIKGLRTPFLEEFTQDGRQIKNYPEIEYSITDNYSTAGRVTVNLELSNKSSRVKFYRGEFTNGIFDTSKYVVLNTNNGKSSIGLRKAGSSQPDRLSVIAETVTDFGNKYLMHKEIILPYSDLR